MSSVFHSSVGKKYLMAVTGIVWAGFVFAHMIGNFLLFFGADTYNKYSHLLTSGIIIYVAEFVLVVSLMVHVINGVMLTIRNKKAKKSQYLGEQNSEKSASFASRTMAPQGLVILTFIILHLAGFKYGNYYETTVDGIIMRDLYRLVVEVFRQPGYVAWYILSLMVLGIHLSHGFGSVFQSLGMITKTNESRIKQVSMLYAILVVVGFISQPIYVYLFVR